MRFAVKKSNGKRCLSGNNATVQYGQGDKFGRTTVFFGLLLKSKFFEAFVLKLLKISLKKPSEKEAILGFTVA